MNTHHLRRVAQVAIIAGIAIVGVWQLARTGVADTLVGYRDPSVIDVARYNNPPRRHRARIGFSHTPQPISLR